MKRSELEHVLRAAGAITGVSTWVVIGSQAILGALPDAPSDLLVSQDADLFAPDDESASDLVDGTPEVAEQVRGRLMSVSSP